ncbi:hypothetical protein SLEP1_g50327 [Rubroshorea leprosula]|uniref:Secreted protein n=1 Tax=Rubroshorea leprosula TaxID=152421 RepID=A0AAV5M204_9ROSI|nr:hypothetical protein SLEP1_g50327 [Rubroshorea leprosula]
MYLHPFLLLLLSSLSICLNINFNTLLVLVQVERRENHKSSLLAAAPKPHRIGKQCRAVHCQFTMNQSWKSEADLASSRSATCQRYIPLSLKDDQDHK